MLTLNDVCTDQRPVALDHLSVSFEAGRIYTILGQTGAGKTELLRALAGVDDLRSGAIQLDDEDLARTPVHRRQMSLVYQQFINYPHLSVRDNVAFPLRRQGQAAADAQQRADEALALVGLTGFEKRKPGALSGGQQQRVALARAIAKRSRILMLDEPLANLDFKLREQLREEIPRLLHENADGVILYTTTDPAEAMELGDRTLVMAEGRIVANDTPQRLFSAPPNVAVARVISEPPIRLFPGTAQDGSLTLDNGPTIPSIRFKGLQGPVQIGLRPDALTPGGDLQAQINLTEFTGSATILHLNLPFGEAVMTQDGIADHTPGDTMSLKINPEKVLAFGTDGQNLLQRGAH